MIGTDVLEVAVGAVSEWQGIRFAKLTAANPTVLVTAFFSCATDGAVPESPLILILPCRYGSLISQLVSLSDLLCRASSNTRMLGAQQHAPFTSGTLWS